MISRYAYISRELLQCIGTTEEIRRADSLFQEQEASHNG